MSNMPLDTSEESPRGALPVYQFSPQPLPFGDEAPWEVRLSGGGKKAGRGRRRGGQDPDALTGENGAIAAPCKPGFGPGGRGRDRWDSEPCGKPVPYRHLRESAASNTMSGASKRRRTQVAKGEVCKTSIQRFESARRLHPESSFPGQIRTRPGTVASPNCGHPPIDPTCANPGHPLISILLILPIPIVDIHLLGVGSLIRRGPQSK